MMLRTQSKFLQPWFGNSDFQLENPVYNDELLRLIKQIQLKILTSYK